MPSNDAARLLASMIEHATIWEVAAALMGIAAVGYALWGAIDNVFDLRYVKEHGVVGGPRWITASFLLTANLLFLLAWIGYTHVAMTAAYLPARGDIGTSTLSEIAVMRLGYGFFGLLAQATLRLMRSRLRGLSREQWAPLFGEAARWEMRALEAEGKYHAARVEVYEQRAEKHDMGTRAAKAELRVGLLERRLRAAGIEVPAVFTTNQEPEITP